jgi:hypothetical protein
MTARAEIVRIEFHNASETNYHYNGQDGYSLPAGQAATTVTFKINEDRNTHSQFTVVMAGRYGSVDAMIDAAWLKLAARLEGYALTAQELRDSDKKRQEAKPAQSVA